MERPARGLAHSHRQAQARQRAATAPRAEGRVTRGGRWRPTLSSQSIDMNKFRFVRMIPSILTTAHVDNCLARPCSAVARFGGYGNFTRRASCRLAERTATDD